MEQQKDKNKLEIQTQDQQLEALLGRKVKKRRKKWPLLVVAVAILAMAAGAYQYVSTQKETSAETVYREYTVERGDIVVGSTESSSISLNRETISFPVSTTVEEVYVKAGSYVEEGQPLMKLNLDQIETGLLSYELELNEAGLTLDQAKLNQTKGRLEASQRYDNTQLEAEQAGKSYELQIEELEQSVKSAKYSLRQAEENYDDYMEQYYDDYCELEALEDDLYDAKKDLKSAQNSRDSASVTTDYNGSSTTWKYSMLSQLEEEIKTRQAEYDTLPEKDDTAEEPDSKTEETPSEESDSPDTTGPEEGDTGADTPAEDNSGSEETPPTTVDKAALAAYLEELQSAKSTLEAHTSSVNEAQTAYNSAEKSYESFAESFEKTYGTLDYDEDYNTNIANLEMQIEKAELSLEKTKLSYESGVVTAGQKEDTSETNAAVADTELALKETEYQSAVDTAQEAYDALANEIEEIRGYISEDGTIYSTCTGMVASISFEAGDSFEVSYNPMTEEVVAQTLLTLTNISDIYVPITISEEDILNVSIGQEASVTMTAFPDETFEAEVDTLSVESSRSGAATVSYTVNVRFKGENTRKMLEGMSAEVTLVQWQVQDVLYINSSCVTNVGGKATVLVRGDDGLPVEREVHTGFSDGRYVEILEGLSEGETVLLESTVRM